MIKKVFSPHIIQSSGVKQLTVLSLRNKYFQSCLQHCVESEHNLEVRERNDPSQSVK